MSLKKTRRLHAQKSAQQAVEIARHIKEVAQHLAHPSRITALDAVLEFTRDDAQAINDAQIWADSTGLTSNGQPVDFENLAQRLERSLAPSVRSALQTLRDEFATLNGLPTKYGDTPKTPPTSSGILTAQDARNQFEDVMADYSTFVDDGETLTDNQKDWLRGQEDCVREAVRNWVTLLGGKP